MVGICRPPSVVCEPVRLVFSCGPIFGGSCLHALGLGVDTSDQRFVTLASGCGCRHPGADPAHRFQAAPLFLLDQGRRGWSTPLGPRFSLVELPLALVSYPVPLIGHSVALVGDSVPLVGRLISHLGGPLALLDETLRGSTIMWMCPASVFVALSTCLCAEVAGSLTGVGARDLSVVSHCPSMLRTRGICRGRGRPR
jgi:hypothetical protein